MLVYLFCSCLFAGGVSVVVSMCRQLSFLNMRRPKKTNNNINRLFLFWRCLLILSLVLIILICLFRFFAVSLTYPNPQFVAHFNWQYSNARVEYLCVFFCNENSLFISVTNLFNKYNNNSYAIFHSFLQISMVRNSKWQKKQPLNRTNELWAIELEPCNLSHRNRLNSPENKNVTDGLLVCDGIRRKKKKN